MTLQHSSQIPQAILESNYERDMKVILKHRDAMNNPVDFPLEKEGIPVIENIALLSKGLHDEHDSMSESPTKQESNI